MYVSILNRYIKIKKKVYIFINKWVHLGNGRESVRSEVHVQTMGDKDKKKKYLLNILNGINDRLISG